MSFRWKSRRFVWTVGLGLFAVFLGAGGIAIGFNLHSTLNREYSQGYRANLSLIPSLSTAFFSYASREHAIADPEQLSPLVKELQGQRIAVYRPWKGYKIPVFDGLDALGLDVSILESGFDAKEILGKVDVLIFPQGDYHLRQLPDGERERIREVVRGGVNYIGLCAGTYFAVDELGIAPIEHVPVRIVGIMSVKTLGTSFWGDFGDRSYQVHYANGGYFPKTSLGDFRPLVESENLGYAAVRGHFGAGQVVLFTFHPEGGGLTLNNQSVYFNGRDLGSGELLLWTLRQLKNIE